MSSEKGNSDARDLSSSETELGDTISGNTDEKESKELEDVINSVSVSHPVPNPVRLYTVKNEENVCCASVDSSTNLLATGSLSNEVRVCDLAEAEQNPSDRNIPVSFLVNQKSYSTILHGHCGPVFDVAFVSGAQVLLSASHDTTMRAWRIGESHCAAVYKGHTYPLWCLATSRNGMQIATGSKDKTVRLWNLDRLFPLRTFVGHSADVNCVCYHPYGRYVASGSEDKSVRLWCVNSGSLVRIFMGHTGFVQALALSPDGKYLASGGDEGSIKIWDLTGGKIIADILGNGCRVVALDWSKCGSFLASASNSSIKMWDVNKILRFSEINLSCKNPLCGHNTECSSLISVQFSDRNTCIVVGSSS